MKAPPSAALVHAAAAALQAELEEISIVDGAVQASPQLATAVAALQHVDGNQSSIEDAISERDSRYGTVELPPSTTRAIEDVRFPFEHLSDIAELESWRKELNRPVYHLHKWWAQRLGSVFRAMLIGSFAPEGSDVLRLFYQRLRLSGAVVFDPFMGSGTTVGETLKLGARAIGRDINPVAYFVVRNALSVHSRQQVIETFRAIERDVAPVLRGFYQACLPGGMRDVLYYFWVKVVPCPHCAQPVDLFSSYVFAKHAYPSKHPGAHALCPHCGAINRLRYDADRARCATCGAEFHPNTGPARGATATCPGCNHAFAIAKAVRRHEGPPAHRLYAKMVLQPDGSKHYLPIDEYDLALYTRASSLLRQRTNAYPVVAIEPGHNTNQALNYCYTHWHHMFNDRQLYCSSVLAQRIGEIADDRLRDLFTCLFSGTLEFNNMFASFKGEGTGAVRHMFSHHILKPERMPLEANLWGTPKSSGAFSTLFESRLLRALDYCENPFEIGEKYEGKEFKSEKVFGLSCPLGHDVAHTASEFQDGKDLYLSCGDSAHTDLPDHCVDAIVTDPPFFDNVHYSELADFFFAWQSYMLNTRNMPASTSTRSVSEVQQRDPTVFTQHLCNVWTECHRVLRPDGLLVFTYHHSRAEGWQCLLEAIVRAGFGIVAAHPIKAEMSVATPKQQAKEPIDLDIILVCRKREAGSLNKVPLGQLLEGSAEEAIDQVVRFNTHGRYLSRNDVRVVLMAHIIKNLSWQPILAASISYLNSHNGAVEKTIDCLHTSQQVVARSVETEVCQLALW